MRKGKASQIRRKANTRAKHESRLQRKKRMARWAKQAAKERVEQEERERPPRVKRNGVEITK
jgi:hypothetical protein